MLDEKAKCILNEMEEAFGRRKFVAGLLISMIDFTNKLDLPDPEIKDFGELLEKYPKEEKTGQGKQANTLIVRRGNETISLRPFYNEAERLFRTKHSRFDYPSCAPHATQAWKDYENWLDMLTTMPIEAKESLRTAVVSFVLKVLPNQAFDPSKVLIQPPLFKILLEKFNFTAPKKEPSGAAFQGAVFGFIRADNPHLQVEIDKVRTGSKRLQRVGDIDAWDGERLAISAEVKSREVRKDLMEDISGFANSVSERGAIGLLISLSFSERARSVAEEVGLRALDREDLIRIVELWDPSKQRIAVESMVYYAAHVEKNSVLKERLRSFIEEENKERFNKK